MLNTDFHLHSDWPLQAKRAARNYWYVVYMVKNLTTGQSYLGRHTVKAGKKPFESNSYWGSDSTVKRWRKQGDHLVVGVLMYSSKKDLNQDEPQAVDFYRGLLGRQLKNKEKWERQKVRSHGRVEVARDLMLPPSSRPFESSGPAGILRPSPSLQIRGTRPSPPAEGPHPVHRPHRHHSSRRDNLHNRPTAPAEDRSPHHW